MKGKTKRLILIIVLESMVLLWFLTGCSRKGLPTSTDKSSVTDSSFTKYTPREIERFTPEVTVSIIKKIECDPATNKPRPTKVSTQNKQLKASAQITADGDLIVDAQCDSLRDVITVLDKEVFRLRNDRRIIHETKVAYKTRRIDIVCRWFAGISLAIVVIVVYRRVRKILLPI